MIDTHAHLLFIENAEQKIHQMKNDGLEAVVTIGTTVDDSEKSIKLAEKYDNIFVTVGIYPEYAEDITDEDLKKVENLAKNPKVVAVGEIGLDYHNKGYNKEAQHKLFIKQLEIADRLGLPFCVHCRGAVEDVYKILSENKHLMKYSGLMHCYSEGGDWVQKFLSLGMYISFSGNITFKKNDRSFLKDVPLDKIVVETDAPYLSPEPLRGRKNEPKNVKYVIKKIADEIGVSKDELEKITSQNARRFYFKMNTK